MTATSQVLSAAPAELPRAHPARAFLRNRIGVVGAVMIAIVALVALFAPWIAPYDPYVHVRVTVLDIFQGPSSQHLLGTDDAGKDVLSSLLYGARVSLIVGFAAAFISLIIGGSIGLIAGYFGGRLGAGLMRFTDFFLVIPDLALLIVIVAVLRDRSLFNLILVIGALGWTTTARLVRSQTLSLRERKFVLRARAVGGGDWYILRRHILPLALPLMLANTVLVISLAILSESTLSFIGLGDPTVISWGQMLDFAFGRGAVSAGAWWALLPPGFAIVWIVLGTTLLGTAMEEAFNPRLRRHHLEADEASVVADELVAEPPVSVPAPSGVATTFAADSAPVLQVRNLTVEFDSPSGPLRAVEDVSFDLRRGETLGLVGESGCGKTTTVMGMLRLLPPGGRVVAGQVLFGGRDVLALDPTELRAVRWAGMSIVFQGAMNALNPVRTIADQISETILVHEPEMSRGEAGRRSGEMLERVGISARRATEYPHTFSGGMRQRAMIALALACQPDVVIADEPTTALDVMVQAQILELLAALGRDFGMGTIIVTHDLGVVAQVCDRVVVMYGGRVAENADVRTTFAHPRHPYTQLLLKAFPNVGETDQRLRSIPGTPPRLDALPPGCRFTPRCPYAFERCSAEVPPLFAVGDDDHGASCFLVVEPERAHG
ncbi:MAG TPA: dipeptide/oligopeptide/nickel ABC transporter permease/ATP-binding protein [Candidatus Dormibacteraeota bacterium]|nr:dipeptide/oligopeptide/nickel ABC transporter permease/ATP-binding protein [Candidatus Dormibacteraeota bacterium]